MAKKKEAWYQILMNSLHNRVMTLNNSKIFAGVMIIIINIASKFVNFKVSKTLESYLKFTFSRDILVFAITWMGTRDIYIALGMTLIFIFMADYMMNENSSLCFLPKSYINEQVAKLDTPVKAPSQEDVIKAKLVLEKAGVKQTADLADAQMNPEVYKESFTTN